jgi:hypothetical protein
MFVVKFPEHYNEAKRWGVLSLFILIQLIMSFLWLGSVTLMEKINRLLSREKGAEQSCTVSWSNESGVKSAENKKTAKEENICI